MLQMHKKPNRGGNAGVSSSFCHTARCYLRTSHNTLHNNTFGLFDIISHSGSMESKSVGETDPSEIDA